MSEAHDWSGNYFNYFTEVEEHFQKARGTSLFLMSPVDWALVESWKNSGVPLEAVLRGIDDSFEKYHARSKKVTQVNSLSYCAQAVAKAAQELANQEGPIAKDSSEESLPKAAVLQFVRGNAATIGGLGFGEEAASLEEIAGQVEAGSCTLEQAEQRLTVLEEKLMAKVRAQLPEQKLLELRQSLDSQLKPHRSRMSAGDLKMLEENFQQRALFEMAKLPRLSLFFLY